MSIDSDLRSRVAALEAAFRAIDQGRMAALPIRHAALRVEAVGFRLWQGAPLGILITPWFMNLLLLPAEPDEWSALPAGSTLRLTLPAGEFDFQLASEEGVGRYRFCSLFSPMNAFEDQAGAVATAEAVLTALFTEPGKDQPPAAGGVERRLGQRLSRRELLRGAFLRD